MSIESPEVNEPFVLDKSKEEAPEILPPKKSKESVPAPEVRGALARAKERSAKLTAKVEAALKSAETPTQPVVKETLVEPVNEPTLRAEAKDETDLVEEVHAELGLFNEAVTQVEDQIAAILQKTRAELPPDAPAQLAALYVQREEAIKKAIEKNKVYADLLQQVLDSPELKTKYNEAFVASYNRDLTLVRAEIGRFEKLLQEPKRQLSVAPQPKVPPKSFFSRIGGFVKGLFGFKRAAEKPSDVTPANDSLERDYQLAADVNTQLDEAIEKFAISGSAQDQEALRQALQLQPRIGSKDEAATKLFYAKVLANKVRELRQESRNLTKAHLLAAIVGELDASVGQRLQ